MIIWTDLSMTWLMMHQMLSHHSIDLNNLHLNFFLVNRDYTDKVLILVKPLIQLLPLVRNQMASTKMFMISFTATLRDSLGQDLRKLSFQTAPKSLSKPQLDFIKDLEEILVKLLTQ